MAAQQVGRILLIPKGDYSASAVYNTLDWVRFSGAAWVCKVDGTTNVTPTTSAPEWQLLAEDGTVGGWSSLSGKPFETIGAGLNVNLLKELEVAAKNTYIGTGTSSDRPISGQGVKDALGTLDVTDTAVSGQYVSAVSETDGKISVTRDNLPSVTTEHSGTASTTAVRKQTITINSTAYDVDGSVYMEATQNASSFVFTNSTYIQSTSVIEPYTDTWGDVPNNVTVDGITHSCTVTFSAAQTRTVRIYIK